MTRSPAIALSGVAMLLAAAPASAEDVFWIDTLDTPGRSEVGTRWSAFTDRVMGGMSDMFIAIERIDGERAYRMTGTVRTENNGGFMQIALPLPGSTGMDLSDHGAVHVRVRGNGERYAIHLRTPANRVPWDYYAAEFVAPAGWTDIVVPFEAFERARGSGSPDLTRVTRIALVGIGRDFDADLAVSRLGFGPADR